MSTQNELRRINLANLNHKVKRLRIEIDELSKIICINLDCSLHRPEDLQIEETDSQWDELKTKWAELSVTLSEIARLEDELK